jgi:flagella basal body P-ring formation protein FlgA
MTPENINILSIVENTRFVRFIHAFLLSALVMSANAESWQGRVEQDLLSRWRQLTADETPAAISFIGISSDYQLRQCQHSPTIRLVKPLQAGRNGIELQCGSPYWSQHLAVQLHVYKQVVVLTQPIRNKQAVTTSDIRLARQDIGELNKGFFVRLTDVAGLESKRGLPPGTVLSPDMLEPPILVKRGDKVAIRVNRPGIQVEMDGIAMGSGQAGERIRVRNRQSNKIVFATVIARGLVQVK